MALARHAALLAALVLAGAWSSYVEVVEARPSTTSGTSTSSSSSSTVRLCGRRLADLVWMLCMDRGGVHSHMDRRALGAPRARPQQPFVIYRPSLPRRDGQGDDSSSDEQGTTAASITANTYHHSSGHSNGGGIVDECCRKACSFSTLASYCARPSAGSSLDSFNMLVSSPAEAKSAESGMQGDQAVEPSTESPSLVESHVQHAQEVNREHNEVEQAGPASDRDRSDGPASSPGRVLIPGATFLRSPGEDTPFGPRARIGTFSRHRPFFYVVQAAFNGDADDEALDA